MRSCRARVHTLKTSATDHPAKDGDSLRSIITSSRSTENPDACLSVELRLSDSHIWNRAIKTFGLIMHELKSKRAVDTAPGLHGPCTGAGTGHGHRRVHVFVPPVPGGGDVVSLCKHRSRDSPARKSRLTQSGQSWSR